MKTFDAVVKHIEPIPEPNQKDLDNKLKNRIVFVTTEYQPGNGKSWEDIVHYNAKIGMDLKVGDRILITGQPYLMEESGQRGLFNCKIEILPKK